jgi:hypothetical protein
MSGGVGAGARHGRAFAAVVGAPFLSMMVRASFFFLLTLAACTYDVARYRPDEVDTSFPAPDADGEVPEVEFDASVDAVELETEPTDASDAADAPSNEADTTPTVCSGAACVGCCDALHPTAAGDFIKAQRECACTSDRCNRAGTCDRSFCAASPTAPEGKCLECLNNNTKSGGACRSPIEAACTDTPESCQAYRLCMAGCGRW